MTSTGSTRCTAASRSGSQTAGQRVGVDCSWCGLIRRFVPWTPAQHIPSVAAMVVVRCGWTRLSCSRERASKGVARHLRPFDGYVHGTKMRIEPPRSRSSRKRGLEVGRHSGAVCGACQQRILVRDGRLIEHRHVFPDLGKAVACVGSHSKASDGAAATASPTSSAHVGLGFHRHPIVSRPQEAAS